MATPATIGRYQISRLIKRGGMGAVYLGLDPVLKREVAIKLLRDDLDDEEFRERFWREALAIAALRHPNIVTIFEAAFDEARPYIAMEYLPGDTLADLIHRRAPLSVARKLEIIADVCSALGAAHQARIVHRDIKPANVMVDTGGVVKVLDFGIARTPDATLTRAGALVGTLDYMAPEQLTDQGADERTDIFAVGALLYELISYRRAFPGDGTASVATRVQLKDPPRVDDLCRDVHPDIAAIVATALQPNPDRRYQDMDSFREALTVARQHVAADVESTLIAAGPRRLDAGPRRLVLFEGCRWRRVAMAAAGGAVILLALPISVDPWLVHLPVLVTVPSVAPAPGLPVPARPPIAGPETLPPEGPDTAPSISPTAGALPALPAVPHLERVPPPTPSGSRVRAGAPAPGKPPTQVSGPLAVALPPPMAPSAPEMPVEKPAPGPSEVAPSATTIGPVGPVLPAPISIHDEGQLVMDVVRRYLQAMTDRNVAAMGEVRRLDGATAATMQDQFNGLRSWKVTLAEPFVHVDVDASVARVTGRIRVGNVVGRNGSAMSGRSAHPVTIELRKLDGHWKIVEVE